MATNKTQNLKLNSWVGTDGVRREEMNENFQKIDTKMGTVDAQLADKVQKGDLIFNIKDFGVKGGNVDEGEKIQGVINSLSNLPNATLLFSATDKYTTSIPIYNENVLNVIMEAPLIYTGSSDVPIMTIGKSGTTFINKVLKLDVSRLNQSSWDSEENIGVKIINLNTSKIKVINSSKSTIGVQFMGSAQGFAYNRVELGRLYDNRIAIDLTNELTGWVNENAYYDGRLSNTTTTHKGKSRYGVRITSKDGAYPNNNNNVFFKTSFELKPPTTGEAIPIIIEHGSLNTFDRIRNEDNSETTMRVLNDSSENNLNVGYGDAVVDDLSNSPSSFSRGSRNHYTKDMTTMIFDSGTLDKKACFFDGSTTVHIPNVAWSRSSGAEVFNNRPASISDSYIEISSLYGIGVFVDTSQVKSFLLRKDTVSGYGGRVFVRCYDASDSILTTNQNYVKGTKGNGFTFSTGFGGVWRTGIDADFDRYFTVHNDVKKIFIFIAGVTNPLRLKSFSLYTKDKKTSIWTSFEDVEMGRNLATAPPTSGTWKTGKRIGNALPTPGAYEGWVCTSGGTPGTWKGFGLIQT
jgi:hypothetical protein